METRDNKLIWESFKNDREIDIYIEHVLFNGSYIIEEGILGDIGGVLKNVGSKVKDAFQKYNPQEIYNRAYINISNKKDQLQKMHPNASKLLKIAANPRNIKLAMMAITLLGTLAGMDLSSASDVLSDLPDDEGTLQDQLLQSHQAAENMRDADANLAGTNFDTDTLAQGGMQVDYGGIDEYLNELVQSGSIDQQGADQIIQCIDMQSGLEMGELLEGITVESYNVSDIEQLSVTDDSGVTVTGEDSFESYIKTTVTDRNGNELVLAEIKQGSVTNLETQEVQIVDQQGGLKFDIIKVMTANINKLPYDQQSQIWEMIMDREFDGVRDQFTQTQQIQENNLIWHRYITEAGETQIAQIQQKQQQYVRGLQNLALVMAQRAIRKQVPVGTNISAKQL